MRYALPVLAVVFSLGGAEGGVRADPAVARQTEMPTVSVFDAESLGGNRFGFAFGAGFPYVQAMAAYGPLDGLDLDVNVDSLYGVATVFSAGPKLRLVHGGGAAIAFEIQAQAAWFRQAEAADLGSRQLIGVRNFDFQPQLIFSDRGKYGAVFGAFIYQGTFDTEPVSNGPLLGNPGSWSFGSNLGAHVGFELAALGVMHPYAQLGLDIHTRSGDDVVMLFAEFGFSFPS